MKQCETFLSEHQMIAEGEPFFCQTPHPQAAVYIVAWIMHSCDTVGLDGKNIAPNIERSTYGHAQKMRAAATYGFGRLHGLGMQAWHQSEISGKMLGNPSVSETVSTYMVSLRRRKVRAGETSTSARAISTNLLEELYYFNKSPEFQQVQAYRPSTHKAPKEPLGIMGRTLLTLGYNIAFCGLLRIDELLKIQFQDLKMWEDPQTGQSKVTLTLPFRKTSQFGDIKPFVWWQLPEDLQHLCVVRALARWLKLTRLRKGFLFCRMHGNHDRLAEANEPMTSDQFLELFRHNLIDIKVDYTPYGTHSFRRGGCQWLSVERRWSLRQICEWGGWSQDFTNLTIVKYLISWNDNPHLDRDDFFNMHRPPTVACLTCNRTCHCA
ncbi:DNA breaking-rejoining enzyme [Lentinula raphanica]|nr:DNA breaking-rejoining enzyme [Lentinula raphanica]